MPLTLLERDVLPVSKPCDGGVAAGALLGVKVTETFDAVGALSLRREGLSGQRHLTARAEEALFMPHFVFVGHSSFGQSLLAEVAAGGEASFVTGHTVVVVVVGDKGLCSEGLLTTVAREAVLVPRGAVVLQHPGPWHHRLVAGHTFGGELVAVAVAADQTVVLTREGLVRQRPVTAETPETVLVVMSVLVKQLLEGKKRRVGQFYNDIKQFNTGILAFDLNNPLCLLLFQLKTHGTKWKEQF